MGGLSREQVKAIKLYSAIDTLRSFVEQHLANEAKGYDILVEDFRRRYSGIEIELVRIVKAFVSQLSETDNLVIQDSLVTSFLLEMLQYVQDKKHLNKAIRYRLVEDRKDLDET